MRDFSGLIGLLIILIMVLAVAYWRPLWQPSKARPAVQTEKPLTRSLGSSGRTPPESTPESMPNMEFYRADVPANMIPSYVKALYATHLAHAAYLERRMERLNGGVSRSGTVRRPGLTPRTGTRTATDPFQAEEAMTLETSMNCARERMQFIQMVYPRIEERP